jgi:hypothetical protein
VICGIAAIARASATVEPTVLTSACRLLDARGGDGSYVQSAGWSGVAFARLAIAVWLGLAWRDANAVCGTALCCSGETSLSRKPLAPAVSAAELAGLALAGVVIAVAGALLPATWAARSTTSSVLHAE